MLRRGEIRATMDVERSGYSPNGSEVQREAGEEINLDGGRAGAGTRIWSVLFQQVLGLVGSMQGGNSSVSELSGRGF